MHSKKKIDNFTIYLDKLLGEGSYGKVYEGEQETTGLRVAVKMLDKKIGNIASTQFKKTSILKRLYLKKSKF